MVAAVVALALGGAHSATDYAMQLARPLPPLILPSACSCLQDFLPAKAGIATTFVPISDLDAVAAALTPSTRVIYTESLSNPTLCVADIPALAELAHGKVPQHAHVAAGMIVGRPSRPWQLLGARWRSTHAHLPLEPVLACAHCWRCRCCCACCTCRASSLCATTLSRP
jgi:cystathionine beta-lyase/cystathionine gamma-synthase